MNFPVRRQGNVCHFRRERCATLASMKVPAQRQRNLTETDNASNGHYPHLYYQPAIELVIPPFSASPAARR